MSMAAASPPPAQLQKPSINKFIIALFLTKSKPANTSVRDHLSHLRTFISRGSRIIEEGSGSSHVDTVEFWRDSYHKSEAKQTELRVKIRDLEQRLGRLSTPARATSSQPSTQGKRKRNEGVAGGSNGRVRKAKTTSNILGIGTCVEDLDMIALDLNVSGDMEASKFLHDVHMLRRKSEQQAITAGELASHLIHICLDMRRTIASVETPLSPSTLASYKGRKGTTRTQEQAIADDQAAVHIQTEKNLTAIARAFPILLSTFNKVSYMSEGSQVAGQMIHHLISILRDLLDRLCLLCTTVGREKHAAALRTKKPQARAAKQIADYLAAPSAGPGVEEGRQSTKLLCQLGIAIMNALDPFRAADNDVLEGFLFFLLHRAGQLLRDFVFCDEEEQDMDLLQTSGDSEAAAIRAAQATYLLPLLKHAIILTAKRRVPATPTHARSGRIPSLRIQGSHSSHNSITTRARIKLQNTLLRAVLGDNITGLGESLHEPLDVSLDTYNLKQVQEGLRVGEWFKDEVWKTVGWDVMREVIAWK